MNQSIDNGAVTTSIRSWVREKKKNRRNSVKSEWHFHNKSERWSSEKSIKPRESRLQEAIKNSVKGNPAKTSGYQKYNADQTTGEPWRMTIHRGFREKKTLWNPVKVLESIHAKDWRRKNMIKSAK